MSLASNLYNLGALLKTNLEAKGVTGLNSNMGLTTLANKILEIPQSGGGCNSLILTSSDDFFQKEEEITINAKLNVLNESNVGKQINFSIEKENSNEYYSDYAEFSQVFVDIPNASPDAGKGYYKNSPCVIEFELDAAETFDIYVSTTNAYGPNSISGKVQIVCDGSYITIYKIVNNERVTFNAWKKEFSQSYGFYLKLNSSSSAHDIKVYDDLDSCLFFNSVTDATGNASITYTGVGAGKLIVTASYGTLLQETFVVEDCILYDSMSSSNTLTNYSWVQSKDNNLVLDDDGFLFTCGSASRYFQYGSNYGITSASELAKYTGKTIKLKAYVEPSYQCRVTIHQLRTGSTTYIDTRGITVSSDGEIEVTADIYEDITRLIFRVDCSMCNQNESVKVKDFRVYSV